MASNDAYVMSAWGKANGVRDDMVCLLVFQEHRQECKSFILMTKIFLSDPDARFAEKLGWAKNGRTGRWAMLLDHGKVVYADVEKEKGVNVSFLQFRSFVVLANYGRSLASMQSWLICSSLCTLIV